MKKREAFTFYTSYYDVYNQLTNPADKVAFMDALLRRQFTGVEPDGLEGMAAFAYISQKHSIDKQVKGWEDKTQTKLYPPTEGGVGTPCQQEKEKEQEKEQEKEKEQCPPFHAPVVSEDRFLPSEIVAFVNDTFGKDFSERNLSPYDRGNINNLISVRGYTKEQILTAWGNILLDDFQRSQSFNTIRFSYLSEPKTIERYLFFKAKQNGTSTNTTSKPTSADKRDAALGRLSGRRNPASGSAPGDEDAGYVDATTIDPGDQ